ncbi:hypothetical protein NQ318_000017 [Aromia moschata]|uniref:THAP-type domain-containing protein n=1 Tax=Aromia moschata TaxID=1265417 RepID=A0AAV8YCA6_9CUCU|nr:hypothetical protein NQ318_000017 [Aromia moschata]
MWNKKYMMVSGCSVHNCKNKTLTKGIDVTLFCLPVKLTQKTVWLQRAFGSVDFNRHKDALVCSDHFKEDDFVKQYKGQSLSDPLQKVLKEDAVPSLNLPNFTGDTASNAIVVANKPNAQIAPWASSSTSTTCRAAIFPNAVLQPAQHQFSIQANGESPLGHNHRPQQGAEPHQGQAAAGGEGEDEARGD